jgi:hypothetical protein
MYTASLEWYHSTIHFALYDDDGHCEHGWIRRSVYHYHAFRNFFERKVAHIDFATGKAIFTVTVDDFRILKMLTFAADSRYSALLKKYCQTEDPKIIDELEHRYIAKQLFWSL